ncbi:MAG: sulfatase-like hydrolase/transferase [Polyangia bacterium]
MRIVVVVADSLRADVLGHAGGPCATPFLDRMAAEGTSFCSVFTSAPWTVPSMAALVTGVYPHRLGVFRWEHPILARFPTVFSAAAQAGARVASFVFHPRYLFSAVPEANVLGSSQDFDAVCSFLRNTHERNLLTFVHYWGTHLPYLDRPLSVGAWGDICSQILAAGRKNPAVVLPKLRALYQRAVERFSELFLPRLADAIACHASDGFLVVVTADHGETWGERQGRPPETVFDLHGNALYDESLRVPLLAWGPAWLHRGCVDGLARTVDLAPTLAEILGARDALASDADGVSLASAFRQGTPLAAEETQAFASDDFLSTPRPAPRSPAELWTAFALRGRRWKYLWQPGAMRVFDLQADPGEQHPLPRGLGEPDQGWQTLEQEQARAFCVTEDGADARLRALGYID